jgi:hypothetical protein
MNIASLASASNRNPDYISGSVNTGDISVWDIDDVLLHEAQEFLDTRELQPEKKNQGLRIKKPAKIAKKSLVLLVSADSESSIRLKSSATLESRILSTTCIQSRSLKKKELGCIAQSTVNAKPAKCSIWMLGLTTCGTREMNMIRTCFTEKGIGSWD